MQAARVLSVLALAFLSVGMAPRERIDYTLTPILAGGALVAVEVDLRFRGEADGETALSLPDAWGGQAELYRAITALEAVSGAQLREGAGPAQRLLSHRPNARVHLRYRIVQDHEGPPMARGGNPYRAVVQPGYFHLIGHASFITPEGWDEAAPVQLRVRALPRGWRFASDLEHDGLTLGGVGRSISVGGDFRIHHGADRNIRVAIRGDWGFSDASFVAQANEIISGQRNFWGDESTPYLVTVLPLEAPNPRARSVGGTGLGDAFAFFATANTEESRITRTLAHESLHTWLPHRIGGMSAQNEVGDYWLSEGLTDFYTARMLVRQGLWSPTDYAADFNATLSAYAHSTARTAPNARVAEAFWTDQDMQQLPYQRGRLLAAIWDRRLRAEGRSLDALMHAMSARAAAGEAGPASALLAREAADVGFAADYQSFIVEGAEIALAEDAFAPCGRVQTSFSPRFTLGFDFQATLANQNIVAGIDPAGPAYAAGVRDGMEITRMNTQFGDIDAEVSLAVRDGDGERQMRYMPRSRESVRVQMLVLAEPLEGEALDACRAVLGGAH